MEDWFQICNMRTSLLHLQFIYCNFRQKMEVQSAKVDRANRDRLMQYWFLWQEFTNFQESNFKRLIILKLQSCLACYERDEQIWQLLDHFSNYVNFIEHEMMENMTKLYIGKNVLFNVEEVQQQFKLIENKITDFLHKYTLHIDQYKQNIEQIQIVRKAFSQYLEQLKDIYIKISQGYPAYLKRKLQKRSKQIEVSLKSLKESILK